MYCNRFVLKIVLSNCRIRKRTEKAKSNYYSIIKANYYDLIARSHSYFPPRWFFPPHFFQHPIQNLCRCRHFLMVIVVCLSKTITNWCKYRKNWSNANHAGNFSKNFFCFTVATFFTRSFAWQWQFEMSRTVRIWNKAPPAPKFFNCWQLIWLHLFVPAIIFPRCQISIRISSF